VPPQDTKKASPSKKSPTKSPGKRAQMAVGHEEIEFEIVHEEEEEEAPRRHRKATPLRDKQPAQLSHETPPSQCDESMQSGSKQHSAE